MADLNAILDSIKELKLLEVAELVKMMEDAAGKAGGYLYPDLLG